MRAAAFLALAALAGGAGAQSVTGPARLGARTADFVTVPLRWAIAPGEAAPDEVRLDAELPDGWQLTSSGPLGVADGALLVTLFVPEDAPAGPRSVTLRLSLPDGRSFAVPLVLDVEVRAGVALRLPERATVAPGEARDFTLDVTNVGNTPDTFALAVEGDATLERRRVTLAPGERAPVRVHFRAPGDGSVAGLSVTARSLADPAASADALLVVHVRAGGASPDARRPTLLAGARLSAEAAWPDDAGPRGEGGLTLGGALSDTAQLDARYERREPGSGDPATDRAALLVRTPDWTVLAAASPLAGTWDAQGAFALGAANVTLGAAREARGEGGVFALRARAEWPAGYFASLTHRFTPHGEDEARVGWFAPAGAFRPGVSAVARRGADGWAFALEGRAAYEAQAWLADARLAWNFAQGRREFGVQAALRDADPWAVTVAGNATLDGAAFAFGASARAAYRFAPETRATLLGALGSGGANAELGVERDFTLAAADVRAALTLSVPDARVRAALSATADAWSASATADLDPSGPRAVSAAAAARLGDAWQANVGIGATRATAWRPAASVGLTYAAPGWRANVTYRLDPADPAAPTSVTGAVQADVFAGVTLGVSARWTSERTTVRVAGAVNVATALRTPDAVVNVFGGRDAGTVTLEAFLDRDRDGERDADEPALAVPFVVGGAAGRTDARGLASVETAPGTHAVRLADGADAALVLAAPVRVTVARGATVHVRLAVRETAGVRGRVSRADGAGAPNVTVALLGAPGAPALTTATDADGAYAFTDVPYGEYALRAQPDPAVYAPPPDVPVHVTRGAPLAQIDVPLAPLPARAVAWRASDLTLTPEVAGDSVPPGARVALRATTNRPARRVTVAAQGGARELRSEDGLHWTGFLDVPESASGALDLAWEADADDAVTAEASMLLVDPGVPLVEARVTPAFALPAQVITVRLVARVGVERAVVRDATGAATPLVRQEDGTFTAEVRAADRPGAHELRVDLDTRPPVALTYTVLGRP